ncbi:MAG: TIGR02680 family protein [Lachnospiraceae bacterium]
MNSKWQMHKIGLIDFWYYDEEEFHFLDGRMLLRGANGSGKSVTMQSFIPLLLDGNMRPERLDPFGSRARKMENYLLEEGSEQEERTGYLYMEFKRQDNENYLTIGIGMRARKNKKLDTWYFTITDGRRIGKDMFLYKDLESKIAYTRLELRNRIGEGGKVMESQSEYADCVNRLLFGFETIEEYKEMLELLIQLRTPKLSKDFKPTVINDILSSSLQTLSEDDLRPMSEAIENMDNLKTNLDTLKDSVAGGKSIERVYDSYNQIVLYNKANYYREAIREYKECEKTEKECFQKIIEGEENVEKERQCYEALNQEEYILKEEQKSLDASDAARLKEEELSCTEKIEKAQQMVSQKQKQEEEKKEKRIETAETIKKQAEANEQAWDKIEENLEEMEEVIGDIPFDEFAFMKKDLQEHPQDAYEFSTHGTLLKGYVEKLEKGIEVLQEEKKYQGYYDDQLQKLDELYGEQNRGQRDATQYGNQLQEIKGELVEHIYQWDKENIQLHMVESDRQQITRMVDAFQERSDYAEITDVVRKEKNKKEDQLRSTQSQLEEEQRMFLVKKEAKQAELAAWEEKADHEPEQSDAVRENRRRLQEKGIPYEQFFKTVDFAEGLQGEAAARLEEALLSMGILDALLVPSEYRTQVLEMDRGVCDRYIFGDIAHVKENMTQMLEVDNQEGDILFYQKVSKVLLGIGYMPGEGQGHTWIDEKGNYRLGIVEGTVTGTYQPCYIGARTRENYRTRMIEALQKECEELQKEQAMLEEKIEEARTKKEELAKEWERFPQGTDLKVAAIEYGDKVVILARIGKEIQQEQEKLEQISEVLSQIKQKVQAVCKNVYLTARLDVFLAADADLKDYKEKLTQLQLTHGNYQNGLQNLRNQEETLDYIDGDLENILYELLEQQRQLQGQTKALASIKEQLALTNYEEIKERLDDCVKRLAAIPKEKEAAVEKKTVAMSEIEKWRTTQDYNAEHKNQTIQKKQRMEEAFAAEYQLNYVEKDFVLTEDIEEQASRMIQMLEGRIGNKKQSDLLGSVQESYHQNRGYLLDYNLTMESLFEEEGNDLQPAAQGADISMKRIDITAKYRGVTVKFKELIQKLEVDMAEKTHLLSDKDRELFEDILANTISKKIRARIHGSNLWVDKMNQLMESMQTSSGLKLSLKWKSKRADQEGQLDTGTLVKLLQKDAEIMRDDEVESMAIHFRSKIEEARKISDDSDSIQSFHAIMREVLDYRKWFEFQLESQKTGEKKKELTDRVFFTFSGGEKAMAMYVPLFSAVVAKYKGARKDSPILISLDEAFAGVDEMNIKDMFRLMVEFEFNFMINSQILWGDYETVPSIAVYQLIRPENAKYVTVIPYVWNGKVRTLVKKIGDVIEES